MDLNNWKMNKKTMNACDKCKLENSTLSYLHVDFNGSAYGTLRLCDICSKKIFQQKLSQILKMIKNV